MGNSLIFPAPKEEPFPEWMESKLKFFSKPKQYTINSKASLPFLCYGDRKQSNRIPYFYFKHESNSNKSRHLVIYFHGNSEVLSETYPILEKYYNILNMDVIAPEYPGYGIYNDENASEKTLVEDGIIIVQHCIQNLGYNEENIVVIGRSLGTGVAIQMGTIFKKLKAIVLISSFLSVRYVGEYIAGRTLSKFLPNVFRNEEFIRMVKAPVLFIHGKKDTLVPWKASRTLFEKCNSLKMIHLGERMGHNTIDFKHDIFLPIMSFFGEKLKMEQFNIKSGITPKQKFYLLSEMDEFPYLAFPFVKVESEGKDGLLKTSRTSENVSTEYIETLIDEI